MVQVILDFVKSTNLPSWDLKHRKNASIDPRIQWPGATFLRISIIKIHMVSTSVNA